ncbi:hypothetical protein CBL_03562 [Carabus blaptoides fortunei]
MSVPRVSVERVGVLRACLHTAQILCIGVLYIKRAPNNDSFKRPHTLSIRRKHDVLVLVRLVQHLQVSQTSTNNLSGVHYNETLLLDHRTDVCELVVVIR